MVTGLEFEWALAARDDRLAEQMHGDRDEEPKPDPDRFIDPGFRTEWDDLLDACTAGPTWPEPF